MRKIQHPHASITAQRLAKIVVNKVRKREGALSIQVPIREDKHIDAVVLNIPLFFS